MFTIFQRQNITQDCLIFNVKNLKLTRIAAKLFEKNNRKKKNMIIIKETKIYKWTNGQSQLWSRCSVIMISKVRGKRCYNNTKSRNLIYIYILYKHLNLLLPNRYTDEQNNFRIEAYWSEESTLKRIRHLS